MKIVDNLSQHRFFNAVLAGVILVFCVSWVYWPGLGVAYDYHDAFYAYVHYVAYPIETNTCELHPQWPYFFYTGRPFFGLIYCLTVDDLLSSISDTIVVRFIAFGVLTLGALGITALIRSCGYSLVISTALGIAIATLPGFQLFLHLTQGAPVFWALLFTLIATYFFMRAESRFQFAVPGYKHKLITALLMLLSVTFLIVSSLTYQQFSSLFFLFICLIALSPKHIPSVKRMCFVLVAGVIAYGAHGVIYLAIQSYFIAPYTETLLNSPLGSEQGHAFDVVISRDVLGKLHFFVTELLQRGLRLWSVGYTHPLVEITRWLFPIATFAWCFDIARRHLSAHPDSTKMNVIIVGLGAFVTIAASLVLVNAPNLIAASDSLTGRHATPFQALIVVIICIGIANAYANDPQKKEKSGHHTLVCIALVFVSIGCMQARYNFDHNMARLSIKEAEFIRDALIPRMEALPERILVVQPNVTSLALAEGLLDTNDEYGKITTLFHQDVPWIVLSIYLDLDGEPGRFPTLKVVGCCSGMPEPGPNDLVIDMRELSQSILDSRIGFLE